MGKGKRENLNEILETAWKRQRWARIHPKASNVPESQPQSRPNVLSDNLSIGFALASFSIAVLSPEPNFLLCSGLLAVSMALWAVDICKKQNYKIWGKIACGLLFLVIFAAIDVSWYYARAKAAKDAADKAMAAEQKEVFQLLTGTMEHEIGDDMASSSFAYSNGSSITIVIDGMTAYPYALLLGDGASVSGTRIIRKYEQRLEAGGDAQTDEFLSDLLGPRGAIGFLDSHNKRMEISCADLLIELNYHLESQPGVSAHKNFRFVTVAGSKGPKWIKEGLGSKTLYCPVR